MVHLRSFLNFCKRFHVECLACGSIPEDGSSRMTIFEPPMKAIAKLSLRFIPPDNDFDRVYFLSLQVKSGNKLFFIKMYSFKKMYNEL